MTTMGRSYETLQTANNLGNENNLPSMHSIKRTDEDDVSLAGANSVGGDIRQEDPSELLLEGWMLKQNRSNYWQDRYFEFRSDQTLCYRRKQDDRVPRVVYRISRDVGCEISDVYVEQTRGAHHYHDQQQQQQQQLNHGRESGGGKQLLYCVTISFPDDSCDTVATPSKFGHHEYFREDGSYTGESLSPGWSGDGRPTSPISMQNSITSSRRKLTKKNKRLLPHRHSDVGQRNICINDDSSLESAGLSLPGTEQQEKRKLSFLRKRHKRGKSTTDLPPRSNAYFDDESLASAPDAPRQTNTTLTTTPQRRRRQPKVPAPFDGIAVPSMELSVPNLKFGEYSANSPTRKDRLARSDITGVPLNGKEDREEGGCDINGMLELPPAPLTEVSESHELDGDDIKIQHHQSFQLSQRERIRSLSRILSEEYEVDKKPSIEEQILIEREKLHHQFLHKQRKKRSATTKRLITTTKIGVAAGAAIGVGIITAGVGLAAGLVFLGVSAALGGTAGVAEVGLKSAFRKKDHLTIATTNYELAKLWKQTLDACLEQESFKQSTWGQLYVAEGRKTTNALMNNAHSADEDDPISGVTIVPRGSPKGRSKGQANLFLRDPNFLAHSQARWSPLEGGWISFLGPGAQSVRVFKEERIHVDEKSQKVASLAVRGSTCTPLRTQLVLNAHPTEAFMCIMSYARIQSLHDGVRLSPNSGQTASYRLIEKIDDHTDVIHLFCRKQYLFPSWTEARDFVLLRYWRYEPDGSYVICYESFEHHFCPPHPEFVRGEMHHVYTIAPPKSDDYRHSPRGNECMLTSVVQVDPKGWIPTKPMMFLSNQTYADAFGISVLMQTLDIRDAIENDRFLNLSPDLHFQTSSIGKEGKVVNQSQDDYDLRFVNRERCDSFASQRFPAIDNYPEPLGTEKWAEPDANSFMVRGPSYKRDRVKINAGASIGQLIAVDVVEVDKPIYSGMSMHPSERIQLALKQEKILKSKGLKSDMPPFIFVVNIVLPGPPFYHGVFYFAVDDMSTINGCEGTPCSKLCQRFLFGSSDEFRDRTFKLIPRIVEGNFLVRKAVGSTPAIMGTKLKQCYVRNERFMEVILDCGSSAVATGVIRLSLGYAKTLVVDMGFLLEADSDEHLPERIFGAVRIKYPSFGSHLRKVVET
jgi:hypothetical protein